MLRSPGLVATCCGYSLVRLENKYQPAAKSWWNTTCHIGKEQIMIFFLCLLLSQSRFSLLCFSLSAAFHMQAFVGFCFFPLLSAVLLFLCQCRNFTWLICQLFWCLLNNSLSNNSTWCSVNYCRGAKTRIKNKFQWLAGPQRAEWMKAVGGLMLMVAVCFAWALV